LGRANCDTASHGALGEQQASNIRRLLGLGRNPITLTLPPILTALMLSEIVPEPPVSGT
jgi:hypothetical protein